MGNDVCYEIKPRVEMELEDIEWIHDNPESARRELEFVRRKRPGITFAVWREDVEISDADLDSDVESYEIAKVREGGSRLPATFREGGGHESDDVAIGPEGKPVKVWGPDNPEDRFGS